MMGLQDWEEKHTLSLYHVAGMVLETTHYTVLFFFIFKMTH